MGLDLELLASYAYPIVAAVDLLFHLPHYASEEFSRREEYGGLAASGLVVVTGVGFGGVLAGMCLHSWIFEMSQMRSMILSMGCSIFLWLVFNVLFLLKSDFSVRLLMANFVPLPYGIEPYELYNSYLDDEISSSTLGPLLGNALGVHAIWASESYFVLANSILFYIFLIFSVIT